MLRSGLVRTYVTESAAPTLLKNPQTQLQGEYHAALAQSFVLGDERPARLSRSLQQAALLLVRSPPVGMFFNAFVSDAASDDVGDVQSALQIVCRDGSIVSLVFSLLHAHADLVAGGSGAAIARAPARAAFGDLQRVYLDTDTPAGVRVRSRHFPLLPGDSTAVHCSSHLLLLASEGARVFAAAHRARDKAKRAFFDGDAGSGGSGGSGGGSGGDRDGSGAGSAPVEATSSDTMLAAAAAAAADKRAAAQLSALGGSVDAAWASCDAPDRAPMHMSVSARHACVALTYRQRCVFMFA